MLQQVWAGYSMAPTSPAAAPAVQHADGNRECSTQQTGAEPAHVLQGYVVLNRPYAFLQWVQQYLAGLEEDYVLMAEPDHIFLKPVPLWSALL